MDYFDYFASLYVYILISFILLGKNLIWGNIDNKNTYIKTFATSLLYAVVFALFIPAIYNLIDAQFIEFDGGLSSTLIAAFRLFVPIVPPILFVIVHNFHLKILLLTSKPVSK